MRKLLTIFVAIMAISFTIQAQVAWNAVKVTTTKIPAVDSAYFSITTRATLGQSFNSGSAGALSASTLPTGFAPGDSLVWKVEKGAPYGSIQRIRLVNSRTGQYLYIGKKGGLTKVIYVGPRVDPYNGQKDLYLTDLGVKTGTVFECYAFSDNDGDRIGNWTSGLLTVYSATGSKIANAANQWIFASKKGPQPKPVAAPAPNVLISTNETAFYADGSVKLNVKITKGTADLKGLALLYHGATLIDTLGIDANGEASYTYSKLVQGIESFTLVYTGDQNYSPSDYTINLPVDVALKARTTKVQLLLPTTGELHKDVTLNVKVTTTDDGIVTNGSVIVYVNGIAKNRILLDSSGVGSLVFPNLLVGTENIKSYYVGNGIDYLNSDTVRTSVNIAPSLSSIQPYPVYFDLCAQPVIREWNYKYPINLTNATTGHSFPQDSIPEIQLENKSALVTYAPVGLSYKLTDYKDYYNHADNIVIPIGSGRSSWVNFKTPWINEGAYNIYLSQRIPNSSFVIPISSITLDDKDVYWPGEELTGRWLNFGGTTNNTRRWNAKGNSDNLPLLYIGSVRIDKSDIHDLKISVTMDNGTDGLTLDMLQFIPVDQDSLSINTSAAVSKAKVYYPLFDFCGFARQAGELAISSFGNYSDMALAYQVADPTEYIKKPHTITGLVVSDPDQYQGIDYVTVYRKDKWTRIAEGQIDENATFTAELPLGSYYYEEINYLAVSTDVTVNGYRNFIKSGTFTVTDETAVPTTIPSTVIAYLNSNVLTVKGIKSGARIFISDISGRIVTNTVSTTDSFQKTLSSGIYIVKIVSENDFPLVTKVIVK